MIKIRARYLRDHEGVLLVPWVPPVEDRVEEPEWPGRGDVFQGTQHAYVNWANKLEWIETCTIEQIKHRLIIAEGLIAGWEKAAKEKGHEFAYCTTDGSSFFGHYLRRATLSEISDLKNAARMALKKDALDEEEKRLEIEAARDILGDEADDYDK